MSRRCPVCQYVRDERISVMCSTCGDAMDRANLEGDQASLIRWAARRAIRYERKRAAAVRALGIRSHVTK